MLAANKVARCAETGAHRASGATAGDGTAVSYLYNAMQKSGTGTRAEQIKVLMRNQDWPQRSWAVQVTIASAIAANDKPKGKLFIEQQYAYFGQAQRAMPDLIGFHVAYGDKSTADLLALQCTVTNPRFRAICMDRSRTDAQRQADKMQSEARAKAMVDQLGEKIGIK